MTDMPMGEHTQENMELHIGAAFAGGAKLEEIVKAIRAALVRIFGEASDQFQALNDAMNALARGEELEKENTDMLEAWKEVCEACGFNEACDINDGCEYSACGGHRWRTRWRSREEAGQ